MNIPFGFGKPVAMGFDETVEKVISELAGHRGRRLEAIDREWLASLFAESRLRRE